MINILDKKGFTLTEMMVYLFIFLIFFAISSEFIIKGYRAITFGIEQEEAVKHAKNTVDTLVEEIRKASKSSRGDYLLDDVSEQSFSFYSNIDNDPEIEKVKYHLVNGELIKETINPAGDPLEYLEANKTVSSVANYVNNKTLPIFTYFDTNQNQIINPGGDKDKIRLVNIILYVNVTPEIMPADYVIDMDVHLRNLKDNL